MGTESPHSTVALFSEAWCIPPQVPSYKLKHRHHYQSIPLFCRALTELLVSTPKEGGLALASHFLSPHMNLQQRLLVLDAMSAAAAAMSTPPSRHRQLELPGREVALF